MSEQEKQEINNSIINLAKMVGSRDNPFSSGVEKVDRDILEQVFAIGLEEKGILKIHSNGNYEFFTAEHKWIFRETLEDL